MYMQVTTATRLEVMEAITTAVESTIISAKGGAISWKRAERRLATYLAFCDATGYEILSLYVAERYLLAHVEAVFESEYTRLSIVDSLDNIH